MTNLYINQIKPPANGRKATWSIATITKTESALSYPELLLEFARITAASSSITRLAKQKDAITVS